VILNSTAIKSDGDTTVGGTCAIARRSIAVGPNAINPISTPMNHANQYFFMADSQRIKLSLTNASLIARPDGKKSKNL
jgi:hypothetical protein